VSIGKTRLRVKIVLSATGALGINQPKITGRNKRYAVDSRVT